VDEWVELLRRQSGVVSRRQALRFGNAKALWRRAEQGRWQVPHRGVYVAHNGPLTKSQQLWVAVLAAGRGDPALLAGVAALTLQGLRNFECPHTDVVVGRHRRCDRAPVGVRVHRIEWLAPADVCCTWPPSTSAARSMVDAAAWARCDREARTVIAMCFQQRLVTAAQVDGVLRQRKVVRRRALIASAAADASCGAESLGELDLRELCRREKLPLPSLQQRRAGRYLDAVWAGWGVRAEVDGAHHMEVGQWWADMARHNQLARRNEVLLRFPAWLVRNRPADVADAIRRVLREAGWK
jgi:very-short-patch-repair endonuclease